MGVVKDENIGFMLLIVKVKGWVYGVVIILVFLFKIGIFYNT